jgi:flagellar L-ring protein precursor FlgH
MMQRTTRRTLMLAAILAALATAPSACFAQAESMWARRDPKAAYLFHDYRARQVGDLLTIVVNEATEIDNQEMREFNKQTQSNIALNSAGGATAGSVMARTFSNNLSAAVQSGRKIDANANTTIDRKFTDRMTVVVTDVLPNGNLVIEGGRQFQQHRETRILHVTGVIRPADIGGDNSIQSGFIADFRMRYDGKGPESNAMNQGWGARIFNVLWPF